ncbi:unnamed protein product [Enterobius vermicularis]|uniref:Uncharacterized protein n=1 Tax=Enterobius vermicularis TaxID=51028 RepID=A0A0N4VQD5_ENTVE|nr:unnamed protein product [Enterobius vermicularis]
MCQSPTIQAFAAETNLTDEEMDKMQEVMSSIASGSNTNFSSAEAANFNFFTMYLFLLSNMFDNNNTINNKKKKRAEKKIS